MKNFYLIFTILLLMFFSINNMVLAKGFTTIDDKISQMIVIGYTNPESFKTTQESIKNNEISGVIFYNRNTKTKEDIKEQISILNSRNSKRPLFMMIDQEGGLVSRICTNNGFKDYPSADTVANTLSKEDAYNIYFDMAKSLKEVGINFNLAPCVDMKTNKKSFIAKRFRSYGGNANTVIIYADEFIKAHTDNNVITALKHFPGLGSAKYDSHKRLPDTTNTWNKKELIPYEVLLKKYPIEPVMVGHSYNKKIDKENITSMSKATIDILNNNYNYKGVIIMDAPDMSAVEDYQISEIIVTAINAGVDLFIFPNHFYGETNPKLNMNPKLFHQIIKESIKNGTIQEQQIDNAYNKIINLKADYLK